MAITLLWVAVQEGMGARDLPWWLAAVAAPMLIVAVDCAIHTVGLIGLSPGQMDSVVNAVMLVTAFAMTLGMLWFVRLRPDGAEPQAPNALQAPPMYRRFSPPWPMPMG